MTIHKVIHLLEVDHEVDLVEDEEVGDLHLVDHEEDLHLEDEVAHLLEVDHEVDLVEDEEVEVDEGEDLKEHILMSHDLLIKQL